MYNVEKYIAECLDSILAQTFKDYEVIAVDDCSKDKTCEIVESYIPKFKGRLQLIRSEKNSGGAGTPRNIGIGLSVGEYIFLMDSDDVIIPTAFAEFYPVAKKFDADVVHCEKYFLAPGETVSTDKKNLKETSFEDSENWGEMKKFVTKPTLYTDSLAQRVKDFAEHKLCWYPWTQIVRRSLIANYNLKFTNLKITDDLMFFFFVLCRAGNFVCIPNALYNYRTLENSNSRGNSSADKMIQRQGFDFMHGIELMDNFMNDFDFFKQHPESKYLAFNRLVYSNLGYFPAMYGQFPDYKLDGLIRHEMEKIEDKTALATYMFSRMNILWGQVLQFQGFMSRQPKEVQDFQRQQEIIRQQQQQLQQQAAQIQQLQQQLRNVHDIFR